MKPVDPLPVQIGQRRRVLGQGKRLGLKPPHLGSRGRLCVNSPATHDLAHDGIEGETVGIVDILVARQPPKDQLPERPVKPVDGVLAWTIIAQRRSRNAKCMSSMQTQGDA